MNFIFREDFDIANQLNILNNKKRLYFNTANSIKENIFEPN